MNSVKKEDILKIKENFKGKKVAVIGDMMLDCYFWGDVKRISPEAPVPVVEVEKEFYRFGGAANVALNIQKLGGVPFPLGVIGNDNDGNDFNSLMQAAGINQEGILTDDSRPTTSKTRVIAEHQHVVRIDKESKDPVDKNTENRIIDMFRSNAHSFDAVILEDYNKGVLTSRVIKEIIKISNDKGIITTVDPKFHNFFEYKNVTVFKPNRKETEDAFGIRIRTSGQISEAGERLLNVMESEYVLLTLGEEGLALFNGNPKEVRIPTKARKVADVSGAGDTVISTLTMALTAGAPVTVAANLANYAAGIVCGEVGIVPIELDRLFDTVNREME